MKIPDPKKYPIIINYPFTGRAKKHLYFLFALLILLLSNKVGGQTAEKVHPEKGKNLPQSAINKRKFAIVGGVTALSLGSTYAYLETVWWKHKQTHFHMDGGKDYLYAKNMDKAGHFIGGMFTAQAMKEGFEWAGMKPLPSYLYAGAVGGALQMIIEVKDGFSPSYGFSIGDVAFGTAGSFVPLLKYHYPALDAFTVKLSYYPHYTYYYDIYPQANLIDDYMNQTYWLSLSVNDWLPKHSTVEKVWPDFLTITGGMSIDETWNQYYKGDYHPDDNGKGNFEYFISLDVDWRKILPQHKKATRVLSDALNYIKLPLPALRLGPTVKGYAAYW